MTAGVAHADRRVPAARVPPRPWDALSEAQVQLLLRLATFLALAAFALGHWLSVIQHAPVGRGVLLLLICAAGGVLLWLTGQVELPTPVALAARIAIVLAVAVFGLLVTGLHGRYLHHWGAFFPHLHHGLLGAQSATYPYIGDDAWTKLTLELASPAFLVPAAALAFWPAKNPRTAGVLRFLSLVLLLVFYGTALAERSPHGELGRGFALLLLVAAWVWVPRLHMRDAAPAAGVVIAAAVLALPLAAPLDSHSGWLDYRNWRVLGNSPGVNYSWNHRYGPINWPRRGTTLLYVQASRPFYWKAETLDDFNGIDWVRTSANTAVSASSELPDRPDRRWFHQFKVTVAGLRGDQVIGAGTPQSVSSGAGDTQLWGDGTVTGLSHGLRDGENYTVTSYIPTPTAAQMRQGGRNYEDYFNVYTRMLVPVKFGTETQMERYDPGLWQSQNLGDPGSSFLIARSPYYPMYQLARRLAAKSDNAYDMARNVENYLNTNRFAYDEHPTPRKYPLESFLFKDRIGYCQQFSGTMAMMLRMVGIPARVATGFSPGTPQPDAPGVYKIRDYDAHSWVEVYFRDVGWVTFDPTPASAPAASQNDDGGASLGQGGRTPRQPGQTQAPEASGQSTGGTFNPSSGSSFSWWMVPLGLAVVVLLAIAAWHVRRSMVRRSHMAPDERALEDLRRALRRIGNPVKDGSTLVTVERTLERRAGREASGYARKLREYRYGGNGATLPRGKDRRALRRALARTARPFGRLKALRALPPLH